MAQVVVLSGGCFAVDGGFFAVGGGFFRAAGYFRSESKTFAYSFLPTLELSQ